VKRGYAESEVRAFLRMVSSEAAAAEARERELTARVGALEEELRKPALPPSDQDLITALGEETARVLGQARESAVELKNKAEEHARRVVREAQETARELRTTTQQAIETKTREAEDAARNRAKDIVGEARALRERVLADLDERRKLLELQISDLRDNRGKLVETYEVVERALSHAARVMAEEPSTPPDVPPSIGTDADVTSAVPIVDPPPAPAAVQPAPEAEPPTARQAIPATAEAPAAPPAAETSAAGGAATGSRGKGSRRAKAAPEPAATAEPPALATATGAATGADTAEPATDVGALFEKLRSGRADVAGPESDGAPGVDAAAGAAPAAPADPESADPERASLAEPEVDPEAEAPSADDDSTAELEVLDPAVVARDAALDDVADDLVRRGKRALQDEQNDLLDGLRRQRGKIDVSKVVPPADEQVTRWAHVLQPAVDTAYSAGAGSVEGSGGVGAAPSALLTELSTSVVTPLRERLTASLGHVDARNPADLEIAVAQSLGARYREWRGDQLEGVLGDVLAVAWSRGVFDAAPTGTRLRWVPTVAGKCPDCDDNALEPTVKGSDFPTGQPHPPAHPGCRCLLVVDAG
jgi:cell division septum initiation protein DivIVA